MDERAREHRHDGLRTWTWSCACATAGVRRCEGTDSGWMRACARANGDVRAVGGTHVRGSAGGRGECGSECAGQPLYGDSH